MTNFTWEMPYIMLVLSIEPIAYKAYRKQGKTIVLLLLCSVLWHHTLYANHIYLKKDLEKNATIVLAARMLERIEMLEGYVPGETKVAFVGTLPDNQYLNQTRKEYTTVNYEVGLREEYAATYSMGAYFTMYLNYPLLVEKSVDYSGVEEVQQMPAFPAVGSIQMIDGTAVVKLS